MKIVLLDAGYNIVHEFDDVKVSKTPQKWNRRILQYRGKHYTHHDSQDSGDVDVVRGEIDERIETFVEAEILALNVTLGGY